MPQPLQSPIDADERRHLQTVCLGVCGVGVTLGGIGASVVATSELDQWLRVVGGMGGFIAVIGGISAAIGLMQSTDQTAADPVSQMRTALQRALVGVVGGVVVSFSLVSFGQAFLDEPDQKRPGTRCVATDSEDEPTSVAKASGFTCQGLDEP